MDDKSIRTKVAADLPAEAFMPYPRAAWLLIPICTTLAVGHFWLLFWTPRWFIALPAALMLGSTQLTLWAFAHEAAHGSMLRSRLFKQFCTNATGFFNLYPGELLERWHLTHHRYTNRADADPDVVTMEQFNDDSVNLIKSIASIRIGIFRPLAFMLIANTLVGNVVLWIRSFYLPTLKDLPWNGLRMRGCMIYLTWIIICLNAGIAGSLFGFVLPLLVSNLLWASYALVNHQTSPLTDRPSVLETTIGIETNCLFRFLHWNVCHHAEHHLFPRMHSRYLPLVRKSLRSHLGDQYRLMSHRKSIYDQLTTPLYYVDDMTKTNPERTKEIVLATDHINRLHAS